ncbi:hypothetical protein ACKE5D_08560 [Pediococcus pentosaceus]|uniref:hypothetical protein n=1 Tax=Pediococcus pentosaceus TaxID=1255 RepID=UPI00398B8A2B
MKRRIIRGLNYFNSYESIIQWGTNGPVDLPGNVTTGNYRTVKAYLFKRGGKWYGRN